MRLLSLILNRTSRENHRVFSLLLTLLATTAVCYAQGGGGEKTTSTANQPSSKETIKAPAKKVSSQPITTDPNFRLDGAFQLKLPGNERVTWVRFLRDGEVLLVKTDDSSLGFARNCLNFRENPVDRCKSFELGKEVSGSYQVELGRSVVKFLDSSTFEFNSFAGTYTGRFQGNTLFLKHEGIRFYPCNFFAMTFVVNEEAIHLVRPPYPRLALTARASGQVLVEVVIDENGKVIDAHGISGHPLLQPSAVAAARASKFTPVKLARQPVKVSGVLAYDFVAQ